MQAWDWKLFAGECPPADYLALDAPEDDNHWLSDENKLNLVEDKIAGSQLVRSNSNKLSAHCCREARHGAGNHRKRCPQQRAKRWDRKCKCACWSVPHQLLLRAVVPWSSGSQDLPVLNPVNARATFQHLLAWCVVEITRVKVPATRFRSLSKWLEVGITLQRVLGWLGHVDMMHEINQPPTALLLGAWAKSYLLVWSCAENGPFCSFFWGVFILLE